MSDDTDSDVSVADQHAAVPDSTALSFASTEDGSNFNTVRLPLIPVACWRLNAPGFEFDSSMVAPAFNNEIMKLSDIVANNPGCPAALFGHCDPAGTDELNKTLGDRRAIAIYALLTRQPDLWAYLYDNPAVGDTWGTKAIQSMLHSLVPVKRNPDDQTSADDQTSPSDRPTHYYDGKIDGEYGSGTTTAVANFQSDASKRILSDGSKLSPSRVTATGKADATTRKLLFTAYMDWLCTDHPPPASTPAPPPTSPPPAFKMAPTDFLGGAGATNGDLPKMSLQGCSEFNPVVLLTTSEMKPTGNTTVRNEDDAPNRRVVMFFFKKDTKVDPAVWPCPKVKEPLAGCKKAFWPDGEIRRKSGNEERRYKKTHDTMACRFYDRFARRSPCENSSTLKIWLQDETRQLMAGAKYRIFVGKQTTVDNANDEGFFTVQAPPGVATCRLEWGEVTDTSSSQTEYRYRCILNVQRNPPNLETRDLDNLAYDGDTLKDRQTAFKADYPHDEIDDVHTKGLPKKA